MITSRIDNTSQIQYWNTKKVSQQTNPASFGQDLSTAASQSSNNLDIASLSSQGGLLSKASLILPTVENVQKLSAQLNDELGKFFQANGIESQPPIDLKVDYNNNGKIVVNSDRPDAKHIEELINKDPDLQIKIRDVTAISSHTYGIQESLQFQKEYSESTNIADVIDRYRSLFSQPKLKDEFSLRYDGGNVSVLANGEEWLSSSQKA